ncbi:MAG: hypothetical protein LBB78_00925 [Spirochaetaceae bacterium]|jgi:hypothetical protein|nr:hypothetical protein [Spirochaetaceae bacterium]
MREMYLRGANLFAGILGVVLFEPEQGIKPDSRIKNIYLWITKKERYVYEKYSRFTGELIFMLIFALVDRMQKHLKNFWGNNDHL